MPGGRGDRSDPADRPASAAAGRGGGSGWTVPGYTHVRELGAGRSGRVVLAMDDVTQTPVAIKYLRADDAATRERLTTAARPLSRLEDPNLVQFYEYAESPDGQGGQGGQGGGAAAVVIEYVDGISLRRVLAVEGGVDPEAALSVLSGSLLGLAALHGAGLAHGSVKPENVLITADGTVKVGDAGVGAAPRYQGPERETSPAADIYAATTVFVECLSGAYAVPEPFRAIVAAGLSADPADRPSSAAALLAELDEVATAVYGDSWEPTGRARITEHAASAAVRGRDESSARRARVPQPRPQSEPQSEPQRQAQPEPEPEPEPRPEPGREPAADARAEAAPPAQRRPADFRRHLPYEDEAAPYEEAAHYDAAPHDAAPHEAAPHEAAPRDSLPYDPTPFEPAAEYERRPYGPIGYDTDPFEPAGYEARQQAPRRPYAATGATGRGGTRRRTTRWSRTGFRIAVGAGAAVVLGIGATWYVLSNRGSSDSAANAQATSTPPPAAQPRPPARPAELARAISKAVAARRTATFTYRAAGVAAQGTLRFVAGNPTAYDMNLTPLTGAHPDPRYPVSRVILIGNRGYVGRGGGWAVYPVANAAARPGGGQGRLYATLAAATRQSSSVYDILALLRSGTKVRRAGLIYRGVAVAARLARDRTVADLYARAPRGALVAFTLEMAQNLLPRQLTVTIKAPGGRPRVFRTTYTGWSDGPPIAPPR